MNRLWILDNGHGNNTPGKRSPVWSDGSQLFEWEFNRDIVDRIAYTLSCRNDIRFHVLVPEENDISLSERVERVNTLVKTNFNSILVSIHANAGGGHGWEVWTAVSSAISAADRVAKVFFAEACKEFPESHMRVGTSVNEPHKEANFTILKNTICPAILTENFFYDNEEECRMMMTSGFRQRVANMHILGILKVEGII
jgi:N-acetylmuramoyl-L-alanine amidase